MNLPVPSKGAQEEPDVDVGCEGVDIGERRVTDTRRRMAIMQQLSNIVSAVAHDLEPALRDRPQVTRMLTHPDVDGGVALYRTGEPHNSAHEEFIAA